MSDTKTNQITTDLTVTELYKAFNKLNETFYNKSLPYPYIVILETKRQNAYGWFTPNRIWKNQEKTLEMHEIAMSAEFMNRGFFEVVQTLHHEMIHLYCHINKKKDVNKKYHNTTFKLECLERGFFFDEPPHEVHGWCSPKLTEKTKEIIKSWNLNEVAFSIARIVEKKKPKNSSPKYICPECQASLRGKKGLRIMCMECNEEMELI